MAERIAFRGKMQADLTGIGMSEYLPMVKSRMRRSIKRNALEYKKLIEKVEKRRKQGSDEAGKDPYQGGGDHPVMDRHEVRGPQRQGVHAGLRRGQMLGHRLGEYSHTTKRVQHSAPGIRATRGSKFLAVK